MRAIDVDPVTRIAVVEPGAINAEVKAAAAEHGLWYPPDPSSYEICSIGGNVATNAGGLCCVKYGVTSDYVLGLTVVLADGTGGRLGGPRLKDVAGLSLTKLFVGSEGTLGIITEAVLRLIPAQRPPCTLVATFASLEDATRPSWPSPAACARRCSSSWTAPRSTPSRTSRRWDWTGRPRRCSSSSPTSRPIAAAEIAEITAICEANGATEVFSTDDPEEGEAFVAARRIAIPAVEHKGTLLLEDVGVPLRSSAHWCAGSRRSRPSTTSRSRSSRTRATATPTP